VIPKPDYLDVYRFQIIRSYGIVFLALRLCVLSPIQLNGKTIRRTVEIDDIKTDTVLPKKF